MNLSLVTHLMVRTSIAYSCWVDPTNLFLSSGNFTFVDHRIMQLMGYSPPELLGQLKFLNDIITLCQIPARSRSVVKNHFSNHLSYRKIVLRVHPQWRPVAHEREFWPSHQDERSAHDDGLQIPCQEQQLDLAPYLRLRIPQPVHWWYRVHRVHQQPGQVCQRVQLRSGGQLLHPWPVQSSSRTGLQSPAWQTRHVRWSCWLCWSLQLWSHPQSSGRIRVSKPGSGDRRTRQRGQGLRFPHSTSVCLVPASRLHTWTWTVSILRWDVSCQVPLSQHWLPQVSPCSRVWHVAWSVAEQQWCWPGCISCSSNQWRCRHAQHAG